MHHLHIIIFLAFAFSLWFFPKYLYRNRRFRKAWLGLAYSDKYRLFVARMLCLVLLLFHIAFYAVFPKNIGILHSSLYVFFSMADRTNLKILMALRQTNFPLILLSVVAIFLAFFPCLLSVSITMAFVIEAAYCLPPKGMNKRAKHFCRLFDRKVLQRNLEEQAQTSACDAPSASHETPS